MADETDHHPLGSEGQLVRHVMQRIALPMLAHDSVLKAVNTDSVLKALDTRVTSTGAMQAAVDQAYRTLSAPSVNALVLRISSDVTRLVEQQQVWQSQVAQMIADVNRVTAPALAAIQATAERVRQMQGFRAQQICDLVAPHGWSVDALMFITGDDVLETLYDDLERQGPGEYARLMAQLLVAGAEDIKDSVRDATRRLLPADTVEDFIAPFEDAVDALISDRGVSLVAATMLSRTEGVFTRALKARGHFEKRKSALFTNQEQAKRDREAVVALLDDALLRRPAWGPRVLVTASARERFERARDLLAEQYAGLDVNPVEAPMSRHHVLHDGYGSGVFPEALRATLYYANVVLFLDQRLPPLVEEGSSGTPV